MLCPDNNLLMKLLLGGRVGTERTDRVDSDAAWQHIESCSKCLAALDRLSDDPELEQWRDRGSSSHSSAEEQAACHSLVKRIVADRTSFIAEGMRDTNVTAFRGSQANTTVDPARGDLSLVETFRPSTHPQDLGMLDKYRIVRLLGQGGMAIVFEAIDTELHRTVALKILRLSHSQSSSRERFSREARALAGIRHPHVVSIYSVSATEDGLPYLTMELVDGETLEQMLQRDKVIEPALAASWIADVADGLAAAHQSGLIHRDIKPSNILLSKRPDQVCAKLADFGLARFTDVPQSFTQAGVLLGTPAYMSPEHIAAPETCDARSDIYSLGVTLYEMLTGELPFRGTSHTLLQRIGTDQPPNVRTLNTLVPLDLDTICMKAMHREPKRRYATASEFSADLRRTLQGQPILARRASQLELLAYWYRRNRRVASLLAVVASLLLALASVSTYAAWTLGQADKKLRREKQTVEETVAQLKTASEQAQHQRQIAVKSLNNLVTKTQTELGSRPGTLKVRDALLDMALQGLEEITGSADTSVIDSTTIEAHLRKGEIYESLGKNADTVREYELATQLAERLMSVDAKSETAQRSLGNALMARADLETRRGALDVAAPLYDQALALRESLASHQPDNVESQRAFTTVLQRIADIYFHRAQWDQAQPIFARALTIAKSNFERWPTSQLVHRDLALAEQRLGTIESLRGRNAEAEQHMASAIAINRSLLEADANNRVYLGDLAFLTGNLARLTSAKGEHHLAIAQAKEAIKYYQSLADLDPLDTDAKTKVSGGWLALHDVQYFAGNIPEAEAAQREFIRINKELADAHPAAAKFTVLVAHASHNYAGLFLRRGKMGEAVEAIKQSIAYLERSQRAADATPAYYEPFLQIEKQTLAGLELAIVESDALESREDIDALVLYIARTIAMYEAARQGDVDKAKKIGDWIAAAPASVPLVAQYGAVTVARAYALCAKATKAKPEESAYFQQATLSVLKPLLLTPAIAQNPSAFQMLQRDPDFQFIKLTP